MTFTPKFSLLPESRKTQKIEVDTYRGSIHKLIIICTIMLTLFPLAVVTGYLTYLALTEPYRFESAPLYHQAPHDQNDLVRISGPWSGDLLNPREYPEVTDALWYRVVSERRSAADGAWHRDTTAPLVVERIGFGTIADKGVELGLLSKVSLPLIKIEKNLSPFHRLSIEFKQIAPHQVLTAIGMIEKGVLKDAVFDRLLIFLPEQEKEVLSLMKRKSYHKVFFLGGITLIFLGLMIVMVPYLKKKIG